MLILQKLKKIIKILMTQQLQDSQNTIILLTSILNRMSRMFSEVNDIYLNTLLTVSNKKDTLSISQVEKGNKDIHGEEKDTLQLKDADRKITPFGIFVKEHKKEIQKKFSHLNNKEISQIVGEIWKKTQQAEKDQYKVKAAEKNQKYLKSKKGRQDKSKDKVKKKKETRGRKKVIKYKVPQVQDVLPLQNEKHPKLEQESSPFTLKQQQSHLNI